MSPGRRIHACRAQDRPSRGTPDLAQNTDRPYGEAKKTGLGDVGWYLQRPGFWHGACGPASCWAGGAEGLVEFAAGQSRKDAHTVAHLAAMRSQIWALRSFLSTAGEEIDKDPSNSGRAGKRALTVRHLLEQACTDVLQRFARAYGPYPLAMNEDISRRYQELDLYLRQSHAERALEALGQLFMCDRPA